jgi:hypothetical protein
MARWDAVLRAMKDHPISQRRACVLIGVDPKTVRRDRPDFCATEAIAGDKKHLSSDQNQENFLLTLRNVAKLAERD